MWREPARSVRAGSRRTRTVGLKLSTLATRGRGACRAWAAVEPVVTTRTRSRTKAISAVALKPARTAAPIIKPSAITESTRAVVAVVAPRCANGAFSPPAESVVASIIAAQGLAERRTLRPPIVIARRGPRIAAAPESRSLVASERRLAVGMFCGNMGPGPHTGTLGCPHGALQLSIFQDARIIVVLGGPLNDRIGHRHPTGVR